MNLYILPAIALIEALFLIHCATRMHIGFKLMFNTLALFWVVSFFMRPAVFLFTKNRNIETVIDDPRLHSSPEGFRKVMLLIIAGNAIFCLILFCYSRRYQLTRNPQSFMKALDSTQAVNILNCGYFIGCISLVLENSQFQNPFSKSLLPLVYTTFSVYLWIRYQLAISRSMTVFFFTFGSLGTLIIAIDDNNSKGVLLMPVLIFTITFIWKRFKGNKLNLFTLLACLVMTFIPIFNKLQENKLGLVGINLANMNREELPWFISPLLPLLQRFDQFPRVTDAYFANGNPLGSYLSWLKFIGSSLEWNPTSGRTALSFGQIWNQQVSNQSIPGARFSNVSLAQGAIAEGYIWGGMTSMLLESAIVAFLFILISRSLNGSIYSVFFAIGMIGNGRVFENGSVTLAAVFSSTAKFLLVIYIFSSLFLRRVSKTHETLRVNMESS